jgi:hypothetical protein
VDREEIEEGDVRNFVTGKRCDFNVEKARFPCLIFTPRPSDLDVDAIDAAEHSHDIWMNHETGEITAKDDEEQQYSLILTKEWVLLARLMHNIFHYFDYLNNSLLPCIDVEVHLFFSEKSDSVALLRKRNIELNTPIKENGKIYYRITEQQLTNISDHFYQEEIEFIRYSTKEGFETMPWEKVWEELVGKERADLDIIKFKKSRKNPPIINIIANLRNVVVGALSFVSE